jgi:hypothetical protein
MARPFLMPIFINCLEGEFCELRKLRILGSSHLGCCIAPVLCGMHLPTGVGGIFLIMPVGAVLPPRRSWPVRTGAMGTSPARSWDHHTPPKGSRGAP